MGLRGGIVMVFPLDVTILLTPLGEVTCRGTGFGFVEALAFGVGFLTGMPLGTARILFSDFFRLRVNPPLSLTTSVSGLKLSISTLPSSNESPFFNHTPLFFPLSKIEKNHSSLNLKNPRSSRFVFCGLGGGGGGGGL